ncbi:MAG: RibD family protein [Erysipelotrichaceae bacterium]|nr:RibD family protein [Erysipelotrichaceae bacterium]
MKPYVIYHMTASIDGRITGPWMRNEGQREIEEYYYEVNRAYQADAYMCGRVTMQGSFAGTDVPDTSPYQDLHFDREDYIADADHGYFAVSVDTHGRVNWQDSCIHDSDPGYDNAHIIEILCESVSDAYLGFLRDRKISYLFCGKETLDEEMMLEKLNRYFHIRKLMNEGGAVLGGSFAKKHLIDELSIVVSPVLAGGTDSTLVSDVMMTDPEFWKLESAEPFGQGGVHLVYKRKQQ